jgi:hypothetical protein
MTFMICMLVFALASPQQQPMQPAIGTLVIDATLPVGSARGDYFEAGWLFIDGRLLGRLPVKRTVNVEWGAHDLKIVIGAYTDQQPRYYTVRWPRYFMNRGSKEHFRPAPVIERAVNGDRLTPDVELAASPEPGMRAEWDAILHADLSNLEKAAAELRAKPAGAATVRIAADARVGGPRDFDADQLRFLRRVMRHYARQPSADDVDRILTELIALIERR